MATELGYGQTLYSEDPYGETVTPQDDKKRRLGPYTLEEILSHHPTLHHKYRDLL